MRPFRIRACAALFTLVASACAASGPAAPVPPAERPNIVLMMVEDLSPRIGAFGDVVARTPNLDRLAREGVRYTSVFATSGVCAPSRAAVITGMHQGSIGAQHMRTTNYVWTDGSGRSGYEAVPPPEVKAFPEYLRAAGYYAINNAKTDYQFGSPFTVWDESGAQAHWRNRAEGQPFFVMYSQTATHESSLFPPTSIADRFPGSQVGLLDLEQRRARLSAPTRAEDVKVPLYYPDNSTVRADIARHYDNIQLMDAWVGERMAELKREGVLDNTIVIWTTDHGDGLPRAKRSLYDSGLRAPMIVRFPDGRLAGTVDERLVSFVDLAPTLLALAGAPTPKHLHGVDIFDPDLSPHAAVFAARDRLDEFPDRSRAIRTARHKYIRNDLPGQPFYLPLTFRENLPMMAEMRRMYEQGALTTLQASYFSAPRAVEELYDLAADPDEIVNLARDERHAGVKAELSAALDDWGRRMGDADARPEDVMMRASWNADRQPQTMAPSISFVLTESQRVKLTLASATPGASIGYRLKGDSRWRLFTAPIELPRGAAVEAKAIRYGFGESAVAESVAPG